MRATLTRNSRALQSLGLLTVWDGDKIMYMCDTIEPPWKDNKPNVSRIPTGTYKLKKRWSVRFRWHYHVLGVPGRELILIHPGNTFRHTSGCILPGDSFRDITGDGVVDVVNSRVMLNKLLALNLTEITIKNAE